MATMKFGHLLERVGDANERLLLGSCHDAVSALN